MELKDVGQAVRRHWLLALTIVIVTGAAVLAGLWAAPKTYVASATVSAAASPDAASTGENLDSLRGSIGELANSEDVIADVASRLSEPRSVEDLRQSVSGRWVGGTILVEVEVSDSDPRMAAEIANTVADVLPLYDPSSGAFLFTTSDPARPPATFSSPNLLLGVGVGAVLAVVLAVCGALLRDRRTFGVGDAREVEDLAEAPVLAHLSQPKDPTALPALYPGTSAADVFRQLRIALEAEASADPVSLVVVTGLGESDVNVWLGANLAVSLANVNRRVLLVDGRVGDLDGRPIAAAPGTAGLYEVLTGTALHSALSPGPVDNLTVLPTGDWGGETAETLLETRFSAVMAEAARRFDVVVVLAPSLGRCDDARVMAAGGSLLLAVPDAGVMQRELRRHVAGVKSVGARLLGVVLVGKRAERMAS
jgi:succinoglycan biosynthesis transport protein ExoP